MSVKNAFDRLAIPVEISNSKENIKKSSHLVLPGVGSFNVAMERIREKLPTELLYEEVISKSKPFLGICVGMQVLAEWGYENEKSEGLGWIEKSKIVANTSSVRQPHIGWNSVITRKESLIMRNIENGADFYFVHSYIFEVEDELICVGKTSYGRKFTSLLQKENIFGVQFHPEKSQKNGLKLLENFASIK